MMIGYNSDATGSDDFTSSVTLMLTYVADDFADDLERAAHIAKLESYWREHVVQLETTRQFYSPYIRAGRIVQRIRNQLYRMYHW